jgi:5'-nucleotidase
VHIRLGVVNHPPVKVAEPEKKKGRKQEAAEIKAVDQVL